MSTPVRSGSAGRLLAILLPLLSCLALAGCAAGLKMNPGDMFSRSTKRLDRVLNNTGEPTRPSTEYAAQIAKGTNLEKSGKYDQAREVYEPLIAEHPTRFEAYHRLGIVADRQRRYREAQALYTQAVRLNPECPDLFNDLGYCFFLQGKLEKAQRALLKAVAMTPSSARFRNNLGMVLGYQGRHDEALEQFRHAGSEADAQYNLAFLRAAEDDTDGAKRGFRLALAADPTYEPARRALKSFEQYEADPEGLPDGAEIAGGSIRWVPYTESSESDESAVIQASAHAPIQRGRLVPSTREDTQSLLKRARTLMSERIADAGS